MHGAGERLFAYKFDGYWKDVGTIDSLWEANLDLLNPKANIDLTDEDWRIYCKNSALAPHFVSADAFVQNSLVSGGCCIEGHIDYSVLFANVNVEKGATVKYSIVMPGATVKAGATVQYAMVAENAVIESGAVVGEDPEHCGDLSKWGVTVIGSDTVIGKNARVSANKMTDENVKEGTEV